MMRAIGGQPINAVHAASSRGTLAVGDLLLSRLSLNQITTKSWSLAQAIEGCVRADIAAIGVWRDRLDETGVGAAAKLVAAAGLRVSSLCRGGFLTVADAGELQARVDDNRRAIEDAAELGARCLVMVVGGLPSGSRDLAAARGQVADALGVLAPFAGEHGVRLALEPLHPMYCADRSVLCTLRQALDLAEHFPEEEVGVVVDTFHLWWDPEASAQIRRAGSRIASFQISDFVTPLPADVLLGRGLMGDGHVDFPLLFRAVEEAGYGGDVEVEIMNAEVWATTPDLVVEDVKRRYAAIVSEEWWQG